MIIERRVGYQLKRAQHALRTQMDSVLRNVGLTTPQYSALSLLQDAPGLSGAQLARRCFVTPQTMNTIVVNLEAAGLIVRQSHPEHARVLQAYLTPQGEQLLAASHPTIISIEERMLAQFTEDQRLYLADALSKCADTLEETEAH